MIAETDTDHAHDRVERRVRDLLAANELCAMATVDRSVDPPAPHVCTLFYAVGDDARSLYVLTPPDTAHGEHLTGGARVALAVYDSRQSWTDEKRGLQLFGSADRVGERERASAFEVYADRFPALTELAATPSELSALESGLHRVRLDRAKLFDEPAFGTETWIDARLADSPDGP